MSQAPPNSPLERTLRLLVESHRPGAAEAIAYSVQNSSGEARRIAVSAALDHQQRIALEGVIRIFHEIPSDLQAASIARADVFLAILRQSVRNPDRQVRANTCDFLIRMDDPRVAYLLADLLQDPAEDIAREAQEGLLALANNYHVFAAEVGRGAITVGKQILDTRRYALLDALLTGLRFYKSHERPEMIEALMSLDPRGDEVLMDVLANPMDRRQQVILDILRTSTQAGAPFPSR